jgi:hypothetical protein
MMGGIIMAKPGKTNPARDREWVRQIIRQVCDEFNVTSRELLQGGRGKENLLRLMAIYLARELGGVSWRHVADLFEKGSVRSARDSHGRFRKYLKFIPGLSQKCEELKEKIIRKVDGL